MKKSTKSDAARWSQFLESVADLRDKMNEAGDAARELQHELAELKASTNDENLTFGLVSAAAELYRIATWSESCSMITTMVDVLRENNSELPRRMFQQT